MIGISPKGLQFLSIAITFLFFPFRQNVFGCMTDIPSKNVFILFYFLNSAKYKIIISFAQLILPFLEQFNLLLNASQCLRAI